MPQFTPPPPTPSIPGSSPPTTTTGPIPIAPPPWTLKAKAWTFLYTDPPSTNSSSPQNPNNTPEILQSLPPGSYHPFEEIHPSALSTLPDGTPQLKKNSWLKGVMIVRYEDTDVGPYDELILIPGRATNPHSKTARSEMRISTIYVSTEASVWNGRRNWNIPKHLAVFTFTPVNGNKDLALRVYHPLNAPAPLNPKVPFFTALLKGSSLPKLPLPSISPLPLVQPPLLRSRWPARIQDAAIGTDDVENGRENPWLMIRPSFKGKWGLAYAGVLEEEDSEETLREHGDGVGFPRVKFLGVGTAFEGVVGFGVAEVVS
ncbi:hypothetical protein BJY04DRAFT_154372 [Aspergillus karnatakaensis]|uniref:uncharacterized protein n=1 Tax=Aspergillus karnatakaensis TaxID=1810916 RepID=UPI003CCE2210